MSRTEITERNDEARPLSKNRDFNLLWVGAGVSALGNRVAATAFPLLVLWQGGSISSAGLVAFAAQLPNLLVQLPAGAAVDRWDRRRVMLVCDLTAGLAMAGVVTALLLGHLWIPLLMAAAFVEGSVMIFYRLAERAAVRNVVRPEHLSTALSRNEARGQASGLLGSPLGSALFTLLPWLPFLVSLAGRAVAGLSLLAIRTGFQQTREKTGERNLRAEIAAGMAWLWHQRFLRAAISLVAGSNLVFQATNLAVVLIIKDNDGSPLELGVVSVVGGLGGVLGAMSGGWFLTRLTASRIVIGAMTVWTALVPMILLSPNPVVLGALSAGIACVGAVSNLAAGVYLAKICPDEMQGRAISVASLVSSGTNSLGAVAAGFALAHSGLTGTIGVATGFMALLAVIAVLSPAVRSGREPLK
ncbi:MFS transporter [Streptomyces sasae]|uniref:MFS transporter n=1 Tax=Streptomyces sasae TaxID=1266772 RepID=UPI00292DFFEE|nr:MFS transporter [Streptomyces sasae]